MAYASADDVAALLARELAEQETALVDRRLAQVERMILRRIPDLTDRITSGSVDADDVRDVEAEAVYRVVRDGDGVISESDGQYSYQKRYEDNFGELHITAEEWAVLGIKPSRMFPLTPNIVAPQRNIPFGSGG